MGTTVREPARTSRNDRGTLRLKALFVVVCAAPVCWIIAPALPGGAGESIWTTLSIAGLFALPCFAYAVVIYRRTFVIGVGAALAALELWSIWAAVTGESSTSGLAILWIPFAGIPLVLVGWLLQTWSRMDP